MAKREKYRGGARAPSAKVKEFLARLRGLWSPKYIPQKSRLWLRYGDGEKVRKADF